MIFMVIDLAALGPFLAITTSWSFFFFLRGGGSSSATSSGQDAGQLQLSLLEHSRVIFTQVGPLQYSPLLGGAESHPAVIIGGGAGVGSTSTDHMVGNYRGQLQD